MWLLNTGLNNMKCTVIGKKNQYSHNTSYCLIEVVTKAGLTVLLNCSPEERPSHPSDNFRCTEIGTSKSTFTAERVVA